MTASSLALIGACSLLGLVSAYALHSFMRPYLFIGRLRGILDECESRFESLGRPATEAELRAYRRLADTIHLLTMLAPYFNPLALLLFAGARRIGDGAPEGAGAGPPAGDGPGGGDRAMPSTIVERIVMSDPEGGPIIEIARARLFLVACNQFSGSPGSWLLTRLLVWRANRSEDPAEYLGGLVRALDSPSRFMAPPRSA